MAGKATSEKKPWFGVEYLAMVCALSASCFAVYPDRFPYSSAATNPSQAVSFWLYTSFFLLLAIGFLFWAAILRRSVKSCVAFVGICLGGVFYSSKTPHHDVHWRRRFTQLERGMSLEIFDDKTKLETGEARSIPLRSFKDHAYNGRMVKYRDEMGSEWFLFVQYIKDTGEGFGFAWSEGGTPPPEMAYPKIAKTRHIVIGWYMFWGKEGIQPTKAEPI
jgi:hypothetical protein